MTDIDALKKQLRDKRIKTLITQLDKEVSALPAICRRIEDAFLRESEDWTKQSSVISAKYKFEELMRFADELTWLTEGNDPLQYPDVITSPTESYSITGNEDDGFELRLPLLQKRGYEKKHHQQKIKAESVRAVSENYLKKRNIRRCPYDRCSLIYTVMLGPDAGGNIGDADNLDTKQITDALSGIFFIDDNLTHVELVINAEETETPSFTRLRIVPKG